MYEEYIQKKAALEADYLKSTFIKSSNIRRVVIKGAHKIVLLTLILLASNTLVFFKYISFPEDALLGKEFMFILSSLALMLTCFMFWFIRIFLDPELYSSPVSRKKYSIEKELKVEESKPPNTYDNLFLGKVSRMQAHRFISVSIYISEHDDEIVSGITEAFKKFVSELDFEIFEEEAPFIGSWRKSFIIRSKRVLTNKELRILIQQIKKGFEIKFLEKPNSETVKNLTESIANLTDKTKDIDNVCYLIGDLLFIKTTDKHGKKNIISKSLKPAEVIYINNNHYLLDKPSDILQNLSEKPNQPELKLIS